jgi:hypothetical protein
MGLVGMEYVSTAFDFYAINNASAKFQMSVLENTICKIMAWFIQKEHSFPGISADLSSL